jgi:hypothetical protein
MTPGPSDVLDRSRQDADLSHGELWLRYFELGGMSTAFELEAVLYGALEPSPHDHDVIAHALNERFVELGGTIPFPTSRMKWRVGTKVVSGVGARPESPLCESNEG